MNVFFAVIAGLALFNMKRQKDSKDKLTYAFCFITTMVVLGALEIVPLFLS